MCNGCPQVCNRFVTVCKHCAVFSCPAPHFATLPL
nr:MAG TPA: BovA [Caudoviricetes sp.]DAP57734.1 MAG TPA: BovA [Caudoviricetes sp.]DAW77924.1 MAG TPA: BovA [Caudoviricetes sp.]